MDSALEQLRNSLDAFTRDGWPVRQLKIFVENLENNPERDVLSACHAIKEETPSREPATRLLQGVARQVLQSHDHTLLDHRHEQWLRDQWGEHVDDEPVESLQFVGMGLRPSDDAIVDAFFNPPKPKAKRDPTVDAFFGYRPRTKATT